MQNVAQTNGHSNGDILSTKFAPCNGLKPDAPTAAPAPVAAPAPTPAEAKHVVTMSWTSASGIELCWTH